jgi:hypothetical protein
MTTPAPASSDATSAHYASYGGQDAQYGDFTTYGDHTATGFHPGTDGGHATASFATDPLFGDMPGNGHDTGSHGIARHRRVRLLGLVHGCPTHPELRPVRGPAPRRLRHGRLRDHRLVGRLPAAVRHPAADRRPRHQRPVGRERLAPARPVDAFRRPRRPDPAVGMGHADLRDRRLRRHAVERRRHRRRRDHHLRAGVVRRDIRRDVQRHVRRTRPGRRRVDRHRRAARPRRGRAGTGRAPAGPRTPRRPGGVHPGPGRRLARRVPQREPFPASYAPEAVRADDHRRTVRVCDGCRRDRRRVRRHADRWQQTRRPPRPTRPR